MPSDALTLSQLLAERLLMVPPFQRGYAWEERQITDLFEDLEVTMEDLEAPDMDTYRDHYTGTVVLLAREGTPSHLDRMGQPLKEVDLVDGQQRMTTILLLLHLLAEELRAYDAELATGIARTFGVIPLQDGASVPKLRLQGDLNTFWEDHVLGDAPLLAPPATVSQKRLAEARDALSSFVARDEGESSDRHRRRLDSLYRTVTQHLLFNVYTVTDDADAAIVFETVNARGKPLTELEKVKNYLMFAAGWVGDTTQAGDGADLQKRINTVWTEIYEQLMRFDLTDARTEDQFLRSHWYLTERPVVRDFQGASSVKQRFRLHNYRTRPGELAAEIHRYLHSLQAAVTAYCETLKPGHPHAFQTLGGNPKHLRAVRHNARKWLRAGNPGPFLPLLIGTRLKWANNAGALAQTLDLCERLSFRLYRVLGARADAGQADLNWLAHEMWQDDAASPDDVAERLRIIVDRRAKDERVFAALAAEDNWYRWPGLRYFLYEYEASLTGPAAMTKEWGQVVERQKADTIEHILPQTATDAWVRDFPDERERHDLTHTLGNLMLTWDNSSYSNKPYPEKRGESGWPAERRCYCNGIFRQEQHVAKTYPTWTSESVRQRQRELVEFARRRWHVDPPASLEAPPVEETDEDDEPSHLVSEV